MVNRNVYWLRWTAVLWAATAVISIALITTQVFDPKPTGSQQWRQPLTPQTIPAHTRQIIWLDQKVKNDNYSLRLTAAHQSGEIDVGYGLAIGAEQAHLAISISPLGYTTLQQAPHSPSSFIPHPSSFILPWQTWPHIRTGAAANEIWVDVQNESVTIRINREWLWAGEVAGVRGQMGLVGESFGETAVINFQMMQLFTE